VVLPDELAERRRSHAGGQRQLPGGNRGVAAGRVL
jgi:hypothetical protein